MYTHILPQLFRYILWKRANSRSLSALLLTNLSPKAFELSVCNNTLYALCSMNAVIAEVTLFSPRLKFLTVFVVFAQKLCLTDIFWMWQRDAQLIDWFASFTQQTSFRWRLQTPLFRGSPPQPHLSLCSMPRWFVIIYHFLEVSYSTFLAYYYKYSVGNCMAFI